jgi:hypothetical protein
MNTNRSQQFPTVPGNRSLLQFPFPPFRERNWNCSRTASVMVRERELFEVAA